ncbi:MAG: helix-turn-helix domain-containing protein [Clostridia bacterium]|nr:helix-turn-helix domain-containing protein [Clostridia bacterium]
MLFENELNLLCSTFQKSHIRVELVTEAAVAAAILPEDVETDLMLGNDARLWRSVLRQPLKPSTLYKTADEYRRTYLYLLLPETTEKTVLLIGPYLPEALTTEELLELGEQDGLSPQMQKYVFEYFNSIPVLAETNFLLLMLESFCEHIWNTSVFAVIDVESEPRAPVSLIHGKTNSDRLEDNLVNMKVLEERYAFENELLQAVTNGQIHKEKQLLAAFSQEVFEMRTASPLRNVKNYCIIMNTLLRKAAEQGGVHPAYLDRVSSDFAIKIEQMSLASEFSSMMHEIFVGYCRLVRKHSIKRYSPVVQKTVLLIDSDLSAPLTLSTLAAAQGLSEGYLATVFKRETEKTISEYVREKRMKHAAHLLTTTRLQIQTIALHCGIMDVQYFTKQFKKHTGKTPKEYRESEE